MIVTTLHLLKLKLFILLSVSLLILPPRVSADVPKTYQDKAIDFLNALSSKPAEEIYSYFDNELRREASLNDIQSIVQKLREITYDIQTIDIFDTEENVRGPHTYGLIYHIESGDILLEYTVHLIQRNNEIFIRGFNIRSIPRRPPKLFSFRYASALHYVVFIAFVSCIIIQVSCFFVFILKKGLKRKWLYIITALIGCPIGIGINWITGAFSLGFGFYIPAVRISWSLSDPNIASVSAYFPLGLIFLIKIMVSNRKQSATVKSNFIEKNAHE